MDKFHNNPNDTNVYANAANIRYIRILIRRFELLSEAILFVLFACLFVNSHYYVEKSIKGMKNSKIF